MIECCLTDQSGTLHASNHWFIPFKHECPSRNLTGITYCIGVSLSCKNTDFFHTESQVISYTKIRRYSAQILCSILRFINSVHGSDPLSVRFFPFPGKPGQITCTSDCPFHFNCQVSYSFFRSMSNCFEPAIYLKRVKPFYLGTSIQLSN